MASSDDGAVDCWKITGGRLVASFAQPASITTLGVTCDGNFIAAAGPRVPLTVWSVRNGQTVARLPAGRGVTCLAFTRDAARLAVGTLGGRLSVWHLRPVQLTHELADAAGPFEAVTFAADGLAVASTARDGSIWLRRLPASSKASAPAARPVAVGHTRDLLQLSAIRLAATRGLAIVARCAPRYDSLTLLWP